MTVKLLYRHTLPVAASIYPAVPSPVADQFAAQSTYLDSESGIGCALASFTAVTLAGRAIGLNLVEFVEGRLATRFLYILARASTCRKSQPCVGRRMVSRHRTHRH